MLSFKIKIKRTNRVQTYKATDECRTKDRTVKIKVSWAVRQSLLRSLFFSSSKVRLWD